MINMELKKGMYIRSKDKAGNQFIRKIVDLPEDTRYGSIVVDKDIHNVLWVSKKNVLKASFDLFDLIEVGDYVNGNKVTKLGFDKLLLHCKTIECHQEDLSWGYEGVTFMYTNNDIKDVITKEQFEACKYVIERDE